MKFRKRINVFPGFYLNFSNSGVSSTIGVKNASVTISKYGSYINTSIPGTNFYNRHEIQNDNIEFKSSNNISSDSISDNIIQSELLKGEIKSSPTNELTSTTYDELKETFHLAYHNKTELIDEIEITKKAIIKSKRAKLIASFFIIGFLLKKYKNAIIEKEEYLIELTNQLNNCQVNIDIHFEEKFDDGYKDLLQAYKNLLTSDYIWDITSYVDIDMKTHRSAASGGVTRFRVNFKFDNIDIVKSSYSAFHLENKNGGDLYIYPAFVMLTNKNNEFAFIDLKELDMIFEEQNFLEQENIPSDTEVIGKTWAKVNKDGTPDKRFKGNFEIPIVRYGRVNIKSESGLNESFSISDSNKAEEFVKYFKLYKALL